MNIADCLLSSDKLCDPGTRDFVAARLARVDAEGNALVGLLDVAWDADGALGNEGTRSRNADLHARGEELGTSCVQRVSFK